MTTATSRSPTGDRWPPNSGLAPATKERLKALSTQTATDKLKFRPAAIKLTEAAAAQIKALLAQRGKESLGVRVGVRNAGCSGLAYTLEYVDEADPFDELVEEKGVTVLIDPKAIMFLLGTEMDYVEEKLKSGFTFTNPNEKGRCGCGESFHV